MAGSGAAGIRGVGLFAQRRRRRRSPMTDFASILRRRHGQPSIAVRAGSRRAAASASAALSAFAAGGASGFGSLAATGCGAIFCVASRGCEKLAGVISPGVMTTRAPILVQFHIFVANAIGMRMQPCDAG